MNGYVSCMLDKNENGFVISLDQEESDFVLLKM